MGFSIAEKKKRINNKTEGKKIERGLKLLGGLLRAGGEITPIFTEETSLL